MLVLEVNDSLLASLELLPIELVGSSDVALSLFVVALLKFKVESDSENSLLWEDMVVHKKLLWIVYFREYFVSEKISLWEGVVVL